MRHTIKKINSYKQKLKNARVDEALITDRYSTNYKEWVKACKRTNCLKSKVNKMIREYNYDNGATFGNTVTTNDKGE